MGGRFLPVTGGGTATAGTSVPERAAQRSIRLPARRPAARSGRWTACGASRPPGSERPRGCDLPARSTTPRARNPALAANCSPPAHFREGTDARSRRRTSRPAAASPTRQTTSRSRLCSREADLTRPRVCHRGFLAAGRRATASPRSTSNCEHGSCATSPRRINPGSPLAGVTHGRLPRQSGRTR